MNPSNEAALHAKRAVDFIVFVLVLTAGIVAAFFVTMQMVTGRASVNYLLLYLLGMAFVGSALYNGLQTLLLAAVVSVWRGSDNKVGVLSPRRCSSFSSWVFAEWRFYGVGGMHRGQRFLGFEVALQGTLS